jgi:hypothetical protein
MNKKHLTCSILAIFLLACKPSFAMYGAIFKAARAVGVTTLPVCGLYLFNKQDKTEQKRLELISETAIDTWGKEKMKQLKVPNAESIPFIYGFGWATGREKFIMVPRSESYQISKALELKNKSSLGNFFYKIRFLGDDPDKKIALHSMLLKHEIGHIIKKDDSNAVYALATMPVAVEALSFGVTSAFRKLCNIQSPKTFVKTTLRSCSALGAIVPKALIGSAAYIFSNRYKEARADKFACKNAESRLELEEFEKFFQKPTNDSLKEKDVGSLMFYYLLTGRFDNIPKGVRKEFIEYTEKGLLEMSRQLNDPDISEKRKNILKNILHVANDPDHPHHQKRAENVRKYINKWDAEHNNTVEKS